MGVVYLGRHPQLGFEVAIKVLLAGPNAKPAQVQRFQRELDALAQLQHPGLVDVLEAGERDGRPWFAMRRVEGKDLEERLQTGGPLRPAEVIELGLQLCRALGHAHERGLIHRDLKPANVLCGPNGRYVVTDFGLTKSLEDDSKLSKTGTIQGTPGFWAPEQASGKGKGATPLTDVYGVGATLYAALTGEPPIRGAGMLEVVVATCEQPPIPPSDLVRVSDSLEAAILKCLEKSPADRFQSLAELERALEVAAAEPTRRGPPLWAWALLVPPLAGALTLAVLFAREKPPTQATPRASLAQANAPSPSLQPSPSALPQVGPKAPDREPPSPAELAEIQRAARAGHTEAMVSLAWIYARGEGVPQDKAESARWYQRAAEGGNARAMAAHGLRLLGERRVEAAMTWFRRGAEAGDAECMGKLGICYLTQRGLDPTRGVAWLRRAIEAGNTEAMVNLGVGYTEGRGGLPKDLERAARLYRQAAEGGDARGMTMLAGVNFRGQGVPKNADEGVRWARAAAERGDLEALLYLSEAYAVGEGVEQDYAEALRLAQRAVREGHAPGNYLLGQLHLKGQGVPKDPIEAARLFQIGADANHAASQGELAALLFHGRGVERDVPRALELYRRGAEGRDRNSLFALGVIYYNGKLIQRDLRSALRALDSASGIYPAFFAFLCRVELAGRKRMSAGLRLQAVRDARAALRTRVEERAPLGDWHAALSGFLLGEVGEAELLRTAEAGKTPDDVRARFCEGYFYSAAARALAGDRQGALGRLRACLDHRVDGYKEVSAAEALQWRISRSRR